MDNENIIKKRSFKRPTTINRFLFQSTCKENHLQPIFGISFHTFYSPVHGTLFCTVGGNQANIYASTLTGQIKRLRTYIDDSDEIYYTCAWTMNEEKQTKVILGGCKGIIRILHFQTKNNAMEHLLGHGQSINDIKVHPLNPNLILTASKDHSIRLWNLNTKVPVVIYSGVDGHRDEVIACDIHKSGKYFVSCGMDHAIKVWSLGSESDCKILKAIEASHSYIGAENGAQKSFETELCHTPLFTTRSIHKNYIDSVLWFNNILFSKSCENIISCWKIGNFDNFALQYYSKQETRKKDESLSLPYESIEDCLKPHAKANKIFEFYLTDCELWFIRMCIDPTYRFLAIGNCVGKVFVWDLNVDQPNKTDPHILKQNNCKSTIRQLCFGPAYPFKSLVKNEILAKSENGSSNNSTPKNGAVLEEVWMKKMSLIAVCDDASVWRWDIVF